MMTIKTRTPAFLREALCVAIEPTYFDLEHYDLNPAQIIGVVKNEINANAVRIGMFSHQGYTYYPSRIAPSAPHLGARNVLKEFENECRKQDVRFIVYLNSKWVTDLYLHHPDWRIIVRGKPFSHPDVKAKLTIYPLCPNSPFLDYFKSIIREVVAQSRPAGIYIDNFAIEPFCECVYCRRAYGRPIPSRRPWASPDVQHYLKWMTLTSRRLARGLVKAARSRNPHQVVIFNRGQFWSPFPTFTPEDNAIYAHRIANAIHTEAAVRMYNETFEHINEVCAFGRSIDLPVLTWVEYPLYPSYVPPSPAEAKIKAAKVIANGGRPMVWSLPCAPMISRAGLPGIKDVFSLVARHRAIFNDVCWESFAAILFSSRSVQLHAEGDRVKMGEYRKSLVGAQALLLHNHLPWDLILDEHVATDRLNGYCVLILPDVAHVDRRQAEGIRRFVNGGGNLLATYRTSLSDAAGRPLPDFALADLLGAHYERDVGETLEAWNVSYARFHADHPISNGLHGALFPIGGRYLAVQSEYGVATLLKRCRYYCDYPQPETSYPAVSARRYGRGRVVYIPGQFFRFYHDRGLLECNRLFRQIMTWFSNDQLPILTNLPDTVEVTMARTRSGQRILHVVNVSCDKTRPITEIIPVTNRFIKIRGACRQAVELASGRSLRLRREARYAIIALPPLTGYNVIVLK
ncbi:MAG: beta-galactosidase trimerization domain-containing protein [Kiritimatiellae bacterium]|nr:beta-galactosidase trimerization domain-containing protein [Verrucomicrobiota bacterium]MCG2659656.1 beta-galactosidase trimerization domain-containing protein [Kiritimatiellia bacterium]